MPATSSTVGQLIPAIDRLVFFRSVKERRTPAAIATKLMGWCRTSTISRIAAISTSVSRRVRVSGIRSASTAFGPTVRMEPVAVYSRVRTREATA